MICASTSHYISLYACVGPTHSTYDTHFSHGEIDITILHKRLLDSLEITSMRSAKVGLCVNAWTRNIPIGSTHNDHNLGLSQA